MLEVLTSRRFANKSVAQTWATLLDEGTYLCSQSTMHRLLREHGMAGERRAQATHPARVRPELVATAPGPCGHGTSQNCAAQRIPGKVPSTPCPVRAAGGGLRCPCFVTL